jgi:AhpD family alkylhydroperoxidase
LAAIDYPDLASGDPELDAVLADIRSGRPFVPNLYRLLLWSPGVTAGWVALANSVRFETEIDDRLRELAILLVGARAGCEYEQHHHEPLARRAGATEAEIEAVREWPGAVEWSAGDRAALAFVTAILDGEPASGDTIEELREHVGEKGVVELGALVAYYLGLSHFLIAMAVEIEDEQEETGNG